MKLFQNIFLVSIILCSCLFTACTDDFDAPKKLEFPEITEGTFVSIKDLKARCGAGNDNVSVPIEDDVMLKGKVVSTDRYGNFYRSVFIQDETSGMEVKIGKTQLYNLYKLGQTVYIKLKGLCLGRYNGMVSLGAKVDEGSQYVNTWIDVQTTIDELIIPGPLGEPVQPKEITSESQLNDDMLGTLITIKSVRNTGKIGFSFFYDSEGQMVSVNELETWAIPNVLDDADRNAGYGSHIFTLGSRELLIRTSGYARFAKEKVADRCPVNESASVTAIYSKYQKGSYDADYQLMLNNSDDVVALSQE